MQKIQANFLWNYIGIAILNNNHNESWLKNNKTAIYLIVNDMHVHIFHAFSFMIKRVVVHSLCCVIYFFPYLSKLQVNVMVLIMLSGYKPSSPSLWKIVFGILIIFSFIPTASGKQYCWLSFMQLHHDRCQRHLLRHKQATYESVLYY